MTMDKGLEFFDAWAKTQKEFFETSLKTQEVFRAHWLDSIKKSQESFFNTASSVDSPHAKEIVKLFNAWIGTMINTSELFNDEVVRLQQSWGKTLDNQIDQSKELAKVFSEYLEKAGTK
jgi:hypothetical protein